MIMMMTGGSLLKTEYNLKAIMNLAHGSHPRLRIISGNETSWPSLFIAPCYLSNSVQYRMRN